MGSGRFWARGRGKRLNNCCILCAYLYLFLVDKTNRCIKFKFYWYYYSTCFGQPSVHHQEFLAIHRLWYILCSCDEPSATRSRMALLLLANGSSQLHKMYQSRCMAKNSWWWAESLPETYRVVIPIKLEFSASVGFIQKESVTMHGHTNLKICICIWRAALWRKIDTVVRLHVSAPRCRNI